MSAASDFGVSVFPPPKERGLVFPVLPVPSWTRLEFGDWEKESRTPVLDVSQGPSFTRERSLCFLKIKAAFFLFVSLALSLSDLYIVDAQENTLDLMVEY